MLRWLFLHHLSPAIAALRLLLLLYCCCLWCCTCRGTDFDDPGDVLVDADCQYTDTKGAMFGSKSDIRLHTGFYRAWESVAPDVVPTVWKLLQQVCAHDGFVRVQYRCVQ